MMRHNAHLLNLHSLEELKQEMEIIGADETGIRYMLPKGELLHIKLQNVGLRAANIVKQEMLSRGGEAVLHKEVSMLTKELSDILLIGTRRQLQEAIKKFQLQPFGLKEIARELQEVLVSVDNNSKSKKQIFCPSGAISLDERTIIMGILNITPDSFSDGGKYNNPQQAVLQAKMLVEAGADIIDVGGESTRPGHSAVSEADELARVIPVIEALKKELNVPISIDTYKSEVAKRAIAAGAEIINDVWGFKKDPEMARTAAELDVPVILMHNRQQPGYHSIMSDIISDLRESIKIALEAGVKQHHIILDPGIGFGKTYSDNLIVMNSLEDIVALGYPVLLGTSRKSMIGNALGLPTTERVEGTAATVAIGIMKGCKIMRVHDVKEIKRVSKMADAIVYQQLRG